MSWAPSRTSSKIRAFRYSLPILGVATLFPLVLILSYWAFGATSFWRLIRNPALPPSNGQHMNQPQSTLDLDLSVTETATTTWDWQRTTIPNDAHVHGFTVFDNIYLRNGTFYVVTEDAADLPPIERLLSRPLERKPGVDTTPTNEQLQFITPGEAESVLGTRLTHIQGFSVIIYDPSQFMKHFYHWFGEIILGTWRVYSHLLLPQPSSTASPLPFPQRFILPFISNEEWRDRSGMDGPLMRAAFPDAAIQQATYWEDLKKLGTTVAFERIILVDRSAAHRHPFSGLWFKMIAGTMNISAPQDFWNAVRISLWRNILTPEFIAYNISNPSSLPLVTYISRQGSGRRLTAEDHDGLIVALGDLAIQGVCEVQIAVMEKMSLVEQIELASRSTILLGVHGNGLTHQLWMPPSSRSTVIEIFIPNGYVFDYEILARNMGHRHYAVWNDTLLTYSEGTYHKEVKYPDGFHGKTIPVHAETVTRIIRERLAG
ncbi:hypothetical protein R3P38DRAFT_2981304 [Favolaschia claudopus]|uniref:Glycosyltransferase 61 catalytic domain-containing protein n=1 Tax=Favolaschia claudopus TaxID=2862362 RepID=A0AAW0B1F9_9AGAR